MENSIATEQISSGLIARPISNELTAIHGRYIVECVGKDGVVKWTDGIENLITDVGKKAMLDQYLAGSAWSTGTVYMGLKGTGTAVAADTMASHASWAALNINSARQSVSFSASTGTGTVSKSTSAAPSFSITSSGTVAGVFIVVGGASTNTDTTGTLFSAGDFGTSRSVVSGDTLNITYSVSLA